MKTRALVASFATVAIALLLASCAPAAPAPASAPASPTAAPVVDAPTPSPEPEEPEEAEPDVDPTCETIIPESTVAAFTELGWTAQESEFVIGSTTLDDGISCAWADWEHPSDHGQLFAWAPIAEQLSSDLQGELITGGWIREQGEEGVYLTEDPDVAFQLDDDGYGATYLFGDGWVTFADTKQSLILIDWP